MAKETVENGSIAEQELRRNLEAALDRIHDSKTPTVVERENGNEVVIPSRGEYESLRGTLYILSSSKNIEEINQALNRKEEELIRLSSGKGLRHELGI